MKRHASSHAFLPSLFLALLWFTGAAVADEIILENGDRLTGTVEKAEAGVVILKTDYSKPIEIQMSKIRTISTVNPVTLQLTEGEQLKGRLAPAEAGQVVVEPSADREKTVVDWKKVAYINPPEKIARWKGNFTLAANSQTGNTRRAGITVDAGATRRGEDDRFGMHLIYNYGEDKGKMTSRNTYGSLKYDYFFTKKFYGLLSLEMLSDTFKDLNLQTIVGPGVGYQIWDDPVKFLLFEAGISYFSNDYTHTEDKRYFTARVSSNFHYYILSNLAFSELIIVYPSLENAKNFTLRNEAAFTSPIAAGWGLKFANIFDYNNNPPAGVSTTDLQWILGVQYSF